jgi:hypothetical protein
MNMRTITVGVASTYALAVVAILAGCGSGTAHHHPAAGSCAAWRQGAGGQDLAAVQADLEQTVTPGGGLWQSEGTTLMRDAKAAVLRPPPGSAGPYRAAMNDYAASGADQAHDDVRGAAAARTRGNRQLAAVKADPGGCL